MLKPYVVTFKDGNEFKTVTVKGYSMIGALCKCDSYMNVYGDAVAVTEISFKRYHALNIASAIREADEWDECENECAELCRMAGMESEWREADGETFEAVLIEAAKKLNVEI